MSPHSLSVARARARAEDGFTMIVALGVLLVTSLLCSAVFLAVQGDARVTTADLNGRQAYTAAQAGVQAYLFQLNANSSTNWWQTCTNDVTVNYPTPVTVPGTNTGAGYAYTPVTTCNQSDPTSSLIDQVTGTLRLKVTGTSGSASRTIVASFRTISPLSYLWYSVHETLDPAANSSCPGANQFYYNDSSPPPVGCQLNWTTGDAVNGSLYTQDELLVSTGASPSFQNITSASPAVWVTAAQLGSQNGSAGGPQNASFRMPLQTVAGGAPAVPLPPNNANLLTDAQGPQGVVLTGTVNINFSSTSSKQTVTTCPGPTVNSCNSQVVDLTKTPLIYAQSSSLCTNTTYSPNDVTYTGSSTSNYYGPCGDIYVQGKYANSFTLAAANDIVVTGNLVNASDPNGTNAPSGAATAGLVANQYVRVAHPAPISNGTCIQTNSNGQPTVGTATNLSVTIDAAILTLAHSFFVDNFQCGNATTGTLTVHGALAQYYRGAVGASVGGTPTGYLKNYNYDSRLSVDLPPFLFDLQNTTWSLLRETLCSAVAGTCTSS